MKTLAKISGFLGKYMSLIILAVSLLSLLAPETVMWIQTGWVNYLLMIVMFGMGLTLKTDDFKVVFSRPLPILIGFLAQFLIMPLLGFALGKAFRLDTALLAGVILVGTCPGGTASNVITYLSGGDVALSVGMTAVNTLAAPILTPALTYLFLRTSIEVNMVSMFLSIIQTVMIPIVLGQLVNRFFGKATERIVQILPGISVTGICLIVAAVVSHNAGSILSSNAAILAVVVLHNLLGYAGGFALGRVLKMDLSKTKALSVEVGMQNSGLATVLAASSFSSLPMAAVPGAIFSVWHNISGALLAAVYRRL